MNESGYYNEDIVEQIEYEEKDNLSYFSLTVDSSELLRQGSYALLDITGHSPDRHHQRPVFQPSQPVSRKPVHAVQLHGHLLDNQNLELPGSDPEL